MANKALAKAYAKFQRMNKLTALEMSGDDDARAARKMKQAMSDTWTKRESKNVRGFFDQKKAREIKRGVRE